VGEIQTADGVAALLAIRLLSFVGKEVAGNGHEHEKDKFR